MCTSVSGDRILYPKSTLPPGPKVQSGIQDSSVHRLPLIPNVICPMHMQMFLLPHTLHAHQASHAHRVIHIWTTRHMRVKGPIMCMGTYIYMHAGAGACVPQHKSCKCYATSTNHVSAMPLAYAMYQAQATHYVYVGSDS